MWVQFEVAAMRCHKISEGNDLFHIFWQDKLFNYHEINVPNQLSLQWPFWDHSGNVYYTHSASVGFEHCVSCITYSHLHYVPYIACWVHWYQQCLTVRQMPKGLSATSPLWWYRETTLFSWLHHGLLIANFKSRLITHNTVSFFILNWPNRIDSNWPWWCWSLQILIKRFFIFSASYYIW